MLLDKSQQLIKLSQDKKLQQNFVSNLEAFQTRQKQITDAVVVIQPIVEALKAFRKRGIDNIDLTQKADSILKVIINAEENFRNNPDWIIDNNNFKGSYLKSSVESLKKSIELAFKEAWKSYLNQKMPSTNNDMLNLLAKVEAFKNTVQQIRLLDTEIKEVSYPKNDAEFIKYERKIEQLKLSWNNLNSNEVPEAVLRLLKAAANQEGASLSLFTPEVQDWISKHNFSDSLKIKFVS